MKSALGRAGIALSLLLALGAAQPSAPATAHGGPIVRYVTAKSFADVVFDLDFAITERNLRITGRNTIGEGLRERGYSDFPDIEVIHFCSLELAREVLLIDPGFVAQMPCRITVHEQNGETVISLILLPLDHADARVNAFSRRMNDMLTEIVNFVIAP